MYMVDSLQPILLIMLVVVIVFFLILGVQVFFILQDLRKTITKTNKVLDDTGAITENISGPISSLSSLTTGIKAGSVLAAAKFIKNILSKDHDEEKKDK